MSSTFLIFLETTFLPAFHFDCPIKDLRDGFDMVQSSTFGVDRDTTLVEKTFLEETFGDILPGRTFHWSLSCAMFIQCTATSTSRVAPSRSPGAR